MWAVMWDVSMSWKLLRTTERYKTPQIRNAAKSSARVTIAVVLLRDMVQPIEDQNSYRQDARKLQLGLSREL
jgi:hypothetical protein